MSSDSKANLGLANALSNVFKLVSEGEGMIYENGRSYFICIVGVFARSGCACGHAMLMDVVWSVISVL